MKIMFSIFIFCFFALVAYVFFRGMQLFAQMPVAKTVYIIVYLASFAMLLGGFFGGDYLSERTAVKLTSVGYVFLLAVLYMAIVFLLTDLYRILNHFLIHTDTATMLGIRRWIAMLGVAATAVILCIGYYNYLHPKVTELTLSVANPTQHKTLRIAVASDLHLGNNIGKDKARQFVQLINAQRPDVVMLAGDIADRNIKPVADQRMHEELRQIDAPLGVYGVAGNHDYYADNPRQANYDYYERSGIKMIFDEALLVDSAFYIVGRDDRSNHDRKSLSDIMATIDRAYPVILLDHQPFHLEEAEENGVSMQFSGHTHKGQFFPATLVVNSMYELAYGYKKKGDTHYYVTSGLGLWGPKFRIGSKSELVVVNLEY